MKCDYVNDMGMPCRVSLNHRHEFEGELAKTITLPEEPVATTVNHPSHYGGGDNPYEHVKVAEAWGLFKRALLYNCTKYIARVGIGGKGIDGLRDLESARWYLTREIDSIRKLRGLPSIEVEEYHKMQRERDKIYGDPSGD